MDIALVTAGFAVALACAVLMGFAIQRGATCTVIAVAEVVNKRRFTRLASMVEASLWVLAGLLAAQALHGLRTMPAGYAVSGFTIAGAVLLGIGAYVARACVFGAIARLGSGEWAYVATPIGFFAGCVALGHVALPPAQRLAHGSPVLGASGWLIAVVASLLALRVGLALRSGAGDRDEARASGRLRDVVAVRVWSPHAATVVIGIAFLVMLLLVGAWSYTDALAELARGMAQSVAARTLLLAGLLGGAVLGGWTAGRFRSTRITIGQVVRCFIGGALMAAGTLLIPGGNDGLILVGMPLLWPYAWLAFLTMCMTIAIAQLVGNASARARPASVQTT